MNIKKGQLRRSRKQLYLFAGPAFLSPRWRLPAHSLIVVIGFSKSRCRVLCALGAAYVQHEAMQATCVL